MRRNRSDNQSQSALVSEYFGLCEESSALDVMSQRHRSQKDKRANKLARDKREREER